MLVAGGSRNQELVFLGAVRSAKFGLSSLCFGPEGGSKDFSCKKEYMLMLQVISFEY